VIARLIFLCLGILSFIGLIICSIFAEDGAGAKVLLAGIAINIGPMIAAIVLLGVSCWYSYRVVPIIEEIERRLHKYERLFDK
jgi:hypothetical protein